LHSLADESWVFLLDKPVLPTKLADPQALEFSIKYEDAESILALGHYLPLAIYKNDSVAIDIGILGGLKNRFGSKNNFDLHSESKLIGAFFDFKRQDLGIRIEGFYEGTELKDAFLVVGDDDLKRNYQIPLEATLYYEIKTDLWCYFNIGKGLKGSRQDLEGLNYQIGLNFDLDLGHWGPFFAFDFQYYEKARDQIGLSIRMGVSLCRSSIYLRPRIFIEFREGPSFLLDSFDRYEKSFKLGFSLSY